MEVNVPRGKYILAVSGGVDSMVLLDLLAAKEGVELVVAHFNHGIRPDAAKDEELVASRAKQLGLPYESEQGSLGANASEEAARSARYNFLRSVQEKHEAKSIITAHHQDDKIETALINILRGTGRQGLSAISDNKNILRPLLDTPKESLISYARKYKLDWREDPSNANTNYLRNYLRMKVLPNLNRRQKNNLISYIDKVAKTNINLNDNIATISHIIHQNNDINRQLFTDLPADIGRELMVYWLRDAKIGEFDKKTIERLSMAIKTAKPGTVHPIKEQHYLRIADKSAHFSHTL